LLFEGPGQGQVIREQHIPFRSNWETVITPVVDFAVQQQEVDKQRIALIGISFGGYLVPRALAFEHRIKLGVANGGVYDFHQVCMRVDPDLDKQLDDPEAKKEIDAAILQMMKEIPTIRWVIGNGMFTFGASTPSEWLKMTREYRLHDVIKQIEAKVLVIDAEHDDDMPGQSKQFYNALQCPKDYLFFRSKDGAGEHCQIGAYAFSNESVFNWLEENL
jgi:cephalosporin-C deacetylase-like acetyl esterase